MATLTPLAEKSAGLFVRLVYWFARRRLGRVPRPVAITAHSRTLLTAVAAFELVFERARALDGRLKELAQIKAAMQVGCRFCIDLGVAIASKNGVTEEELRGLLDYRRCPHFSERDRRVLAYTEAMCESPMKMPEELSRTLTEELGAEAMVELTAAIAWENYRARFNHALGAREEGYSEHSVCLLPSAESDLAGSHAR